MTASKLTSAQLALLRAVDAGAVDNLGAAMFYGSIDGGRRQRLVQRVRALDELGLIDPRGVAMKHGKPLEPGERFPDYLQVTLTPDGRQALESGPISDVTDHAHHGKQKEPL